MVNKEQIDTLIVTGATLPPVNPYLDDTTTGDSGDTANDPLTKKKPGRAPAATPKASSAKTGAPDPKEYIAELERSEDENLF